MGLFKKKEKPKVVELKCSIGGCSFICMDSITMKRHTDWAHLTLQESKNVK